MLWCVALLEHIERKHLLFLAHFSCLRREKKTTKDKKDFFFGNIVNGIIDDTLYVLLPDVMYMVCISVLRLSFIVFYDVEKRIT